MTTPEASSVVVEAAYCVTCRRSVAATQRGVISDADAEQDVVLLECNTCGSALLYARSYEFEDDHYTAVLGDRLWPSPNSLLRLEVPWPLHRVYREARRCFDAHAFTAAAVMVRRMLEGVCAESGFRGKTLFDSLEEMRKAGKIDQRLYDWARALRGLGNDAAHYTGHEVSREDAEDALAFAQAFLEYMYVLSVKFEDFEKRRTKKEE